MKLKHFQSFPSPIPGTKISIPNPRFRGSISESNTALLQTNQPLVPLLNKTPEYDLLPQVTSDNEDFSWFSFVTNNLIRRNELYLKHVCSGKSGDDTGDEQEPCGCLCASNRGITFQSNLLFDELKSERVEKPTISF